MLFLAIEIDVYDMIGKVLVLMEKGANNEKEEIMFNKVKKLFTIVLIGSIFFLAGCSELEEILEEELTPPNSQLESSVGHVEEIIEGEYYYEVDKVAEYIHLYGELPANYISKSEAEKMGWSTADKTYVVGGDQFGNREGKLPKETGRRYYEADIQAGYTDHRGPERLVYSDDGLIYYTDDHYDSFEQLY